MYFGLAALAAALLAPEALPWMAVTLALAALAWLGRQQAEPRVPELQRQLMWCRRREVPAAVVVIRIAGARAADAQSVVGDLRLTDSVEWSSTAGGIELRAVLDARDIDRDAVERRVAAAVPALEPATAWALFPEDGLTLAVLVEHARQAIVSRHEPRKSAPSARRERVADEPACIAEAG